MTEGLLAGATHLRGDIGRKLNNALTLTLRTGPDAVLGTAVQSSGDGAGKKLGVLFGFKNGGSGTHVFTAESGGATLSVVSREQQPTSFLDAAGIEIGQAERVVYGTKADDAEGNLTTVRDAAGNLVFRVVPSATGPTLPPGSKAPDLYRTDLLDASGTVCGGMDLVRVAAGWSLGAQLVDDMIWFGHAGQSLPLPIAGTALTFARPPTALEGDLALGMCIDVSIGLRPYIAEMN